MEEKVAVNKLAEEMVMELLPYRICDDRSEEYVLKLIGLETPTYLGLRIFVRLKLYCPTACWDVMLTLIISIPRELVSKTVWQSPEQPT